MYKIKLNISFVIYNVVVFIGVFLFLTIKQSIFDDTVQWLWNIATSAFAMFLNIYIDRFNEKDER